MPLLPPVCVAVGCVVVVIVVDVDVVAAASVSIPSGVAAAAAAAPRCSRRRRCPGDSSSLTDGSAAAAVVRSEAAEAVSVEPGTEAVAAAGVAATETTAERVAKVVSTLRGLPSSGKKYKFGHFFCCTADSETDAGRHQLLLIPFPRCLEITISQTVPRTV